MATILIMGTWTDADGDPSMGEVWLRPAMPFTDTAGEAVPCTSVLIPLDTTGSIAAVVHDLTGTVQDNYYDVTLNIGCRRGPFPLPITAEDIAAGFIDLPSRLPDPTVPDPPVYVPVPGDPGHSPVVTVGTTTTLPPGADATVVDTDPGLDVSLDFGIPEGVQGDKGDPGDATQADIDDAIRDHEAPAIMGEAAWWTEAGSLTAAGDGLADLSGNGRDAIFGADDAAPVVLDHDGEDYVWSGDSGTSANIIQALGYQAHPATSVTWTTDFIDNSTYGGWQAFAYWDGVMYPIKTVGDTLNVNVEDGAGNWQEKSYSAAVPQGIRHTVTVSATVGSTAVDVVVDGVALEQFTMPKPFGVGSDFVGSPQAFGGVAYVADGRVYSTRIEVDGEPVLVLDPSQASDDYATITNTGSAGGDWTIQRNASGFKTAVVDRPLLLFGGGQIAETVSGIAPAPQTVLAAIRSRENLEGSPYDVIVANAGGNTAEGWMLCHRAADTLHGRTDFGDNGRRVPSVSGDFSGQNDVVGMVQTDQYTALFKDAVQLVKDTSDPGMFPENPTGNLTIGGLRLTTGGTTYHLDFEFVAAAIFDRALSDAEIALVSDYLKKDPDNPHPQYVNVTGDTMTGPLTLADAPVEPLEAATKAYVDQLFALAGLRIWTTEYRMQLPTDAAPASGMLSWDGADAATSTVLYLADENRAGIDISPIVATWLAGQWLNIHDRDDAARAARFDLTGPPTLAGNVWTVPVSPYDQTGNPLTDGLRVQLLHRTDPPA